MTQPAAPVALLNSLSEEEAAQSSKASAVRFYRPELDVLRFCAFGIVYFGHALTVYADSPDWLKALKTIAGVGVPLFFALSAFLVTELLRTEKILTGGVDIRAFYQRRILRIWPLYFLVLGIGFLLSHLNPGTPVSVYALMGYVLLLGNWYTGRHDYLPFGLGPLWSIPIEEQFYLLWPWLVRSANRRAVAFICFAAFICSHATLLYLCYRHTLYNPTVWTNSLVQLQYFAIGVGLCALLNGSVPKLRGMLRVPIILGGFLVFPAAEYLFNAAGIRGQEGYSSIPHTFPTFLAGDISVILILVGFLGCKSLESWRSLRYLGKISYGLYLFHPFALRIADHMALSVGLDSLAIASVAGLLVDVGIAWLSYEYFEKPFLRSKERYAIVKSRAV